MELIRQLSNFPCRFELLSPAELRSTGAAGQPCETEKTSAPLTDDDQPFREALVVFLEADGRFEVVGQAENGRTGVELTANLQPDAVLMDIDMPVMERVEASRRIHHDHPELPIVLVSASQFAARVANSREAGATGYVHKGRIASDRVAVVLAAVSTRRRRKSCCA